MTQQQVPVYPQPVYLAAEQAEAVKSISESVVVIRQCVYVMAIFVVVSILAGAIFVLSTLD